VTALDVALASLEPKTVIVGHVPTFLNRFTPTAGHAQTPFGIIATCPYNGFQLGFWPIGEE